MTFSVLISVYKNELPELLDDAISSVWKLQVLKPSEIVLVKDGPLTSELDKVVNNWQEFLGEVFSVLEFSNNRGLGASLNAGLEACKHDLVARMDSDDIALPNRFVDQVGFMKSNPCVDILGSFVEEITFKGLPMGVRKVPEYHNVIIANLWACPIIHPTVMIRRSRILSVGSYNPGLPRRQDYELWFRCAEKGLCFHNLQKCLLRYRFGAYAHRKQPSKVAFRQGVIGYQGSKKIGLPITKRLACFIPFIRSLLPLPIQHLAYRVMKPFDPRR